MSRATLAKITADLYEQDFNLWLKRQAELLHEGHFEELDLENLIEEVQDIGKRDKREVKNRLIVLLTHLLKHQYQPNKRTRSWLDTIDEQRSQLCYIFEDSPSLKAHYAPAILDTCYEAASNKAKRQTGLPVTTFPASCPYSLEQALDPDFLPEG
jgi:hypothetical protein